jgi:hypothetical protein
MGAYPSGYSGQPQKRQWRASQRASIIKNLTRRPATASGTPEYDY